MGKRYVDPSEVRPFKKQFDNWMQTIREEIKDCGVGFTYMLVGSAKRNLVIRHHNKGFDCDYQIRITKNKKNLKAEELKYLFINALNSIVNNYGYSNCENSTSSITIKKKGNNSNIKHSYDIVILEETLQGVKILRYDKPPKGNGSYIFELLPDTDKAQDNFRKIKGKNMWGELRDVYYKKKMIELTDKQTGKKSYQLLNEAVNEVLDKKKRKPNNTCQNSKNNN